MTESFIATLQLQFYLLMLFDAHNTKLQTLRCQKMQDVFITLFTSVTLTCGICKKYHSFNSST